MVEGFRTSSQVFMVDGEGWMRAKRRAECYMYLEREIPGVYMVSSALSVNFMAQRQRVPSSCASFFYPLLHCSNSGALTTANILLTALLWSESEHNN